MGELRIYSGDTLVNTYGDEDGGKVTFPENGNESLDAPNDVYNVIYVQGDISSNTCVAIVKSCPDLSILEEVFGSDRCLSEGETYNMYIYSRDRSGNKVKPRVKLAVDKCSDIVKRNPEKYFEIGNVRERLDSEIGFGDYVCTIRCKESYTCISDESGLVKPTVSDGYGVFKIWNKYKGEENPVYSEPVYLCCSDLGPNPQKITKIYIYGEVEWFDAGEGKNGYKAHVCTTSNLPKFPDYPYSISLNASVAYIKDGGGVECQYDGDVQNLTIESGQRKSNDVVFYTGDCEYKLYDSCYCGGLKNSVNIYKSNEQNPYSINTVCVDCKCNCENVDKVVTINSIKYICKSGGSVIRPDEPING